MKHSTALSVTTDVFTPGSGCGDDGLHTLYTDSDSHLTPLRLGEDAMISCSRRVFSSSLIYDRTQLTREFNFFSFTKAFAHCRQHSTYKHVNTLIISPFPVIVKSFLSLMKAKCGKKFNFNILQGFFCQYLKVFVQK